MKTVTTKTTQAKHTDQREITLPSMVIRKNTLGLELIAEVHKGFNSQTRESMPRFGIRESLAMSSPLVLLLLLIVVTCEACHPTAAWPNRTVCEFVGYRNE